MTFPPPDPNQQVDPTSTSTFTSPSTSTTAPAGGSPRRTASIVALTTGLLVGGVLVGSQFVSANTPGTTDVPATSPTDVAVTEAPAPDTSSDDTPESDDGFDLMDEFDLMDLGSLFGLDPEVTAQFEEFEACLSDQLGDLDLFGGFDVLGEGEMPSFEDFDLDFPDLDSITDFEIPTGVFVEAGDDTGFYEFGEGDGTITITKVGDDINVASDGDVSVQTFELPDFGPGGDISLPELTDEQKAELDATWAEADDTWKAIEEACGDLFPDDLLGGLFDGDILSGDLFDVFTDD